MSELRESLDQDQRTLQDAAWLIEVLAQNEGHTQLATRVMAIATRPRVSHEQAVRAVAEVLRDRLIRAGSEWEVAARVLTALDWPLP